MNNPTTRGLDLNETTVQRSVAGLVAVVGALVLGYLAGTGASLLLVLFGAVIVTLAVVAGLRHRAWVLIPLGWGLTGYTAILPIPLAGRDFAIMLAAISYVAFVILARQRTTQRWYGLDLVLLLNLLWIVATFLRKPAGVGSLGAETIGGRAYVNIFMAAVAFWVILRLPDSPLTVSRIPYFLLASAGFLSLMYAVAYFLPTVRSHLVLLYAMLDVGAYLAGQTADGGLPRFEGLSHIGKALLLVLCARYVPRSLLNPLRLRCYVFLAAMVCVLLSGFRSSFIYVVPAFGLGSWFHRGWREALLTTAAGVLLLAAVAAGQGHYYELPPAAQRSLAFLPGRWDPVVKAQARASSERRFDWWKTIVHEGVIGNWWLGDGFGFSREDHALVKYSGDFMENTTLTGSFHNGPLTTIRAAGVVGLVLFYGLMITGAVYAVRLVRDCQGTPLALVAVFLAIQQVWAPIHFT
ncbi:O-antigen ligase family protein, partial [bacterium]|nr:O-antigen ligase family protein [bacterium]